MPTYEFTSPEGKKYRINGPDGSTKEQAFGILQQQLGAAPAPKAVSGAAAIPSFTLGQENRTTAAAAPQEDTPLQKNLSPFEAALTLGTGAIAAPIGAIAGVGKSLISGKYGTQEGVQEGGEFGKKVADVLTYKPSSQTAGKILETVGEAAPVLEALPGVGNELAAMSRSGAATRAAGTRLSQLTGASTTAAAQNAADVATAAQTGPSLRNLVRAPQQLSGGGAADVSQAAQRAARAQNLPVPLPYTKGMLTRDRQQIAFERETAKQKEGAPIAQRYEDLNAGFMQNLDEGVEQTGAKNITNRSVGKSVVGALEAKDSAKSAEVRNLYQQARDAGEMQQPVDVTALADWVQKNKGKDKLAPIITTIENELKQNAKVEGGGLDNLTLQQRPSKTVMTLDASEDLRQAIGKLSEPGTPNVTYGSEAKSLIDAAQEGKGGDLYRTARRAYENYSNEFANRDVVDRLLRAKPGTKDRAVAYEDVFKKSILDGSTDDVRHMFRVLEAYPAGTDPAVIAAGQQAAKDLRGAVVNHIKTEMQKNLNVDSTGARTGSPAQIDAIVRELDNDGKLDVIFGKKGAEQIRDLRDVAIDIYTSPSGTVNSSNTTSALMRKLDDIASYTKATPILGKAVNYSVQAVKSANTRRKVREAINPNLKDMAGQEGK